MVQPVDINQPSPSITWDLKDGHANIVATMSEMDAAQGQLHFGLAQTLSYCKTVCDSSYPKLLLCPSPFIGVRHTLDLKTLPTPAYPSLYVMDSHVAQ